MDNSSIRPTFSKLTFEEVVLDTSLKLRDAQANGHIDQAFVYFKWMLDFLSNHIPLEERENLEEDARTFSIQLDMIDNDKQSNDELKQRMVKKMKEIFTETHSRYIMMAYPRAGINKVTDDGAIDFTEVDYDIAKKIIRHHPVKDTIEKWEKEKAATPEESNKIKEGELNDATTNPNE